LRRKKKREDQRNSCRARAAVLWSDRGPLAHDRQRTAIEPLAHAEQFASLGVAAGRVAVFTGCDPRQGSQLPPAERRPQEGELFAHRLIVLLCMQGTFLAHGVAQQQVEYRPWVVTQHAVAVDERASAELVFVANGTLRLLEQARSILCFDFL